jgi:putative ABC transport system permease protein
LIYIAFRRLWNRIGLTLLSVAAVSLAVGIAVGIPTFAKAVSFLVLRQELGRVAATSGRPAFSLRAYVLPGAAYPLSLEQAERWETHIVETMISEVGLPLIACQMHVETQGMVMRTRPDDVTYGAPPITLLQDATLDVLPGVGARLRTVTGSAMEDAPLSVESLQVWVHESTARQLGLSPGEIYELWDARRQVTIPIQPAGTWHARDPGDDAWFQNPDQTLKHRLLVRERDYRSIVEPILQERLGYASWYLIFDDRSLTSENMRRHTGGLERAQRIVARYVPGVRIDGSPLGALQHSLQREARLLVLMLSFSVPMLGFLLYFLGLISTIALRWQQRETAILVSRGMRSGQLLTVSAVETAILIGLGLPLGAGTGLAIARAMGYAESFMQFARREPLSVSLATANVPLVVGIAIALSVARLLPIARSVATSVVRYEQRRARAPSRPLWQRLYVDVLLIVPLAYAYRQLRLEGTLVPQADAGTGITIQDPLLFLVPSLFVLTSSFLLVRSFPLLMRIGDWLSALGRRPTTYLAFRQLARQSSQYASPLLLVTVSLGLGGFAASMASSLDTWLHDQVYYEIGSDVLLRQMLDPEYVEAGLIPPDGAWMLPVQTYLELPGVRAAARVGMYEASYGQGGGQSTAARFLGIDRLDLPTVLFFRPDFAEEPLGGLMNRLAARPDGILISKRFAQEKRLEVGDQVELQVVLVDVILSRVALSGRFTIVGQYDYFPTVYEQGDGAPAIIGNLDFLYLQAGGPQIHHIWLRTEPGADQPALTRRVEELGVFVKAWEDARDAIAVGKAKAERVGMFGTLTVGFLAAALFAGISLLIYSYASLRERLFRFTILRAVGLSLSQLVGQITLEYAVLTICGAVGGALIGALASGLFVPFFQAADDGILRPPTMIPFVDWLGIGRICAAFAIVLVFAQATVIAAALRRGVFRALRMGDTE